MGLIKKSPGRETSLGTTGTTRALSLFPFCSALIQFSKPVTDVLANALPASVIIVVNARILRVFTSPSVLVWRINQNLWTAPAAIVEPRRSPGSCLGTLPQSKPPYRRRRNHRSNRDKRQRRRGQQQTAHANRCDDAGDQQERAKVDKREAGHIGKP
jgi:hypothetical protein